LFSTITKCTRSFSDLKVRKEIGIAEKELQQGRKDNQASMLKGRRRRLKRRRRSDKALRMSVLGGSSPTTVVQSLSLLLLAFVK
jgi:hypothetical protein